MNEDQGHYLAVGVKVLIDDLIRRGVLAPDDPNITHTPERFARWASEFFLPAEEINKRVQDLFLAKFPSNIDEMVVVTGTTVHTVCPHHLLPVEMRVSVAYFPAGQVLGLSKLARLAKMVARRPIIQEEYTYQVGKAITDHLSPDAAVHAVGQHYCMIMRGVCEPGSKTVTSALFGRFRSEGPRSEFLSLMNHQ